MLDDVAGANGIAVDFHGINPSEPWMVSGNFGAEATKVPGRSKHAPALQNIILLQ
jgi:hypothetical protein